MLTHYYEDKCKLRRLHGCLSGAYLDDFSEWLFAKGYTKNSAQRYLFAIYEWSNYLAAHEIEHMTQLTESGARTMLREFLSSCQASGVSDICCRGKYYGINHMIKFLSINEIIESCEPAKIETDISRVLADYDRYLTRVHGVQSYTRGKYGKQAAIFMEWRMSEYGALDLSHLSYSDVIRFQTACNSLDVSRTTKQGWASRTRIFLRFLHWQRITQEDLSPCVRGMKTWKLATVPKYMDYDDMRILLSAPDRNTPSGKRDAAILMLLIQLGMRAIEIIRLRLQDVDFHSGFITIRKTKSLRERTLPISIEIAEALVDYIKNGRRNSREDRIFLRTKAPYTPLNTSSSLPIMLRKYLNATGISSPTQGTHQLRHGLATYLINQNRSLKDIADLLGHASINTTGIYAKVHIEGLKQVALPFPSLERGAR